MATLQSFAGWLKSALPGATFTYFVGSNTADAEGHDVASIAAAWRWAVEGRVLLFQRRAGFNRLQYIAMKAPKNLDAKFIPLPFIEAIADAPQS